MWVKRRWTFVVAALVAMGFGVWYSSTNQSGSPDHPSVVVDFKLPDVDGDMHAISDWQGKLRLVNFWATWCPPCREEIPMFSAMQAKYGDQGLQIIGVSLDDAELVRRHGDDIGITYPSLVADKAGLNLMDKYGGQGLPFSLLLDRAGNLIESKTGPYNLEELETIAEKYL